MYAFRFCTRILFLFYILKIVSKGFEKKYFSNKNAMIILNNVNICNVILIFFFYRKHCIQLLIIVVLINKNVSKSVAYLLMMNDDEE